MTKRDFFLIIFILTPALAIAHTGLKGPCYHCHTMHDSQDDSPMAVNGPNPYLLLKSNCTGCHAYSTNNASTGRADSIPQAPQVIDSATPIAGGYFSGSGNPQMHHNVSDLSLPVDPAFTFIPGTATPYNAGSQVTCQSCHDWNLGHTTADAPRLGDATSSYRMLGRGAFYVKGTGDANFEVNTGQNSYEATSINLFCASCHGLFHGFNQGIGVDPMPNSWIRHPTDLSLSQEYPAATFTGNKTVPMGSDGTNTDVVMCLSCHRPHGSGVFDLLRFTYSINQSGDGGTATGCESCHGAK